MARDPEFARFIRAVDRPLTEEEMRSREETTASEKEIGWWKRFQFTRMLRHARAGKATLIELRHLGRHNRFYPPFRSR